MTNRRAFLKTFFVGGAALATHTALLRGGVRPALEPFLNRLKASPDPWDAVPQILRRIKPPIFPDRNFDITPFGALGNNKADCTEAFQKAIAECHRACGGRVVVPRGEFLTGAIHLKSNVNLHLDPGATIRFSRDPRQYPLVFTRWEGVELMNYSPFIYAFEQENIAITGQGTIDGNADCAHWWPWKGRRECGWKAGDPNQTPDRNHLFDLAERGASVKDRVFGAGHFLRPNFIEPYRCKNVFIEGVTLLNSPMWQVHPVLCTNVTVQGLTISSFGPNTDGCDPECCADVLIKDCFFNTGDDCIAIKSGRNADGRRVRVPSQNLIIQGCRMKDGHGGVTVGSEISGGVRNVFAEDCRMDSPNLDMAVRLKNNAMRGGLLENIYVRNVNVGQVATAGVSIDFYYEEGEHGKFTPVVRHVEIRNLKVQKAEYALYLRGFRNAPIRDIRLVDCDFAQVARPNVIENVEELSLREVRINGKLVNPAE